MAWWNRLIRSSAAAIGIVTLLTGAVIAGAGDAEAATTGAQGISVERYDGVGFISPLSQPGHFERSACGKKSGWFDVGYWTWGVHNIDPSVNLEDLRITSTSEKALAKLSEVKLRVERAPGGDVRVCAGYNAMKKMAVREWLTVAVFVKGAPGLAPGQVFPNGWLVVTHTGGTVYLITEADGRQIKRGITSPAALACAGLSWDSLHYVSQADIDRVPDGPIITEQNCGR